MAKKTTAFLVTINVVLIAFYMVLASRGWRNLTKSGQISISGEPYVWFNALPFLVAAIALDLAWGVALLIYPSVGGKWQFGGSILLVVAAVIIDFAHH